MGQAKKRGNFEQRQSAAYERVTAGIEVRKKEIEEMEALEKRQLAAMGNFLNARIIPAMERQHGPLMRIDFSKMPMPVTKINVDGNENSL